MYTVSRFPRCTNKFSRPADPTRSGPLEAIFSCVVVRLDLGYLELSIPFQPTQVQIPFSYASPNTHSHTPGLEIGTKTPPTSLPKHAYTHERAPRSMTPEIIPQQLAPPTCLPKHTPGSMASDSPSSTRSSSSQAPCSELSVKLCASPPKRLRACTRCCKKVQLLCMTTVQKGGFKPCDTPPRRLRACTRGVQEGAHAPSSKSVLTICIKGWLQAV